MTFWVPLMILKCLGLAILKLGAHRDGWFWGGISQRGGKDYWQERSSCSIMDKECRWASYQFMNMVILSKVLPVCIYRAHGLLSRKFIIHWVAHSRRQDTWAEVVTQMLTRVLYLFLKTHRVKSWLHWSPWVFGHWLQWGQDFSLSLHFYICKVAFQSFHNFRFSDITQRNEFIPG